MSNFVFTRLSLAVIAALTVSSGVYAAATVDLGQNQVFISNERNYADSDVIAGNRVVVNPSGTLSTLSFTGQGDLVNAGGTISANNQITSASVDNKIDPKTNKFGTMIAKSITSTEKALSNGGTMTVEGDVTSASYLNNTGNMTLGGSLIAKGTLTNGPTGTLTLTGADAKISSELRVNNSGNIHAQGKLTLESQYFENHGTISGVVTDGQASALSDLILNVKNTTNYTDGTMKVAGMSVAGRLVNLGKVEAVGILSLQSLDNRADATLTAKSVKTESDGYKGNLGNSGKMTVTDTVEVLGFFTNQQNAEFKAGTLTTTNASDSGKSFEVDTLNLNVSPLTEKGLGFFDFNSDTVAKIGTLNTPNGQLKLWGAGVKINSISQDSTVILQVNEVGKVKGEIDTNKGNVSVEAPTELTDTFNPDDISGGLQSVADTINIKDGNKEKKVSSAAGTVLGELEGFTDGNGKIISVKEAVNGFNAGMSEMATIAMLAWRAENDDMFKRLGDVRRGEDNNGAWARLMGGETKYGSQNVKNQYTTIQAGYDHRVGDDNQFIVGGAFSYTDGESSFTGGSGDNYQYGFTMYGSWLSENGQYVDVSAKYSRMKNEYTLFGGVGAGDYYTNGLALSVEYGKRFDVQDWFYVEPQAEVSYGHLSGVEYTASSGAKIEQEDMDSVVGRLGVAFGKSFEKGNVHASVSYLYDWDAETKVSMSYNGTPRHFSQDLGGHWWEFTVGGAYEVADNLKVYGSFDITDSADVETPWQWNIGLRYAW